MTDPIADFLTRVRNAYLAGHKTVEVPASKMKKEITRVLHEKGYILSYKVVEGTPCNTLKLALKYHPQTKIVEGSEINKPYDVIKMALKYHPETKKAAVKALIRVSRPGLRNYKGVAEMPRVLNGLGVAILSTSKGILTDKEAKEQNVGGEVLCFVY